jgi:hypothetical protein
VRPRRPGRRLVWGVRPPSGPRSGAAESRESTVRSHPFASKRFHVLLNSLSKVLSSFPSTYLFAIGLVQVFSLRWSLPPTLGCIPKQPDSQDAQSRRFPRRRGLTPAMGWGPDQEDSDAADPTTERVLNATVPATVSGWGIRRWALPGSLAVTEGILVSFFSSAY